MNLQAILFNKRKYNLSDAKSWLRARGYHPIKYHVTDNYVRARLAEPDYSKYHYRTNNLAKNIKGVVMYSEMPRRRQRKTPPARGRRVGGAIDPVSLFANMVLPALMYAGVSYGIYRAAKK